MGILASQPYREVEAELANPAALARRNRLLIEAMGVQARKEHPLPKCAQCGRVRFADEDTTHDCNREAKRLERSERQREAAATRALRKTQPRPVSTDATRRQKRWTQEETERLHLALARNERPEDVARELSRTFSSVVNKLKWLPERSRQA